MKKSLYKISVEALDLASALEEGELTPELEQALVLNKDELQTKAMDYAYVIKDSEYTVNAINDEIKRLQHMKHMEESKQNRLKDTLAGAMHIYGFDKIDGMVKLSFRSSESVEIISQSQIPDEFKKIKTEIVVDKMALKEALKRGEMVEGAILKKNQNLQVK
jgi:hypothetical protein